MLEAINQKRFEQWQEKIYVKDQLEKVLNRLQLSDQKIEELINRGEFELVKEDLKEGDLLEWLSNEVWEKKSDDSEKTRLIEFIGGAASGKTTLMKKIREEVEVIVTDICLVRDTKWRRINVVAAGKSALAKYDPKWFREQVERVLELEEGEEIRLPELDYMTGAAKDRKDHNRKIRKTGCLIVEGDFSFLEGMSDEVIYFHVPDEVRNWNRYWREIKRVKDKGFKGVVEMIKDMRVRHKEQQLRFTLPVLEKASWLIKVEPEWNGEGYEYRYELYKRSGEAKVT